MTSKRHMPKFDDVEKITFSYDLHAKRRVIRFNVNVFPVGYHYRMAKPGDKEAEREISHLKGPSPLFFAQILSLPKLERLEIRENQFIMDFESEEAWRESFNLFYDILKHFFPRAETRTL